MSSPPINLDNRAAIERVLEKSLEDTQRDLAVFLKARAGTSIEARDERRHKREEPRESEQGARARLDYIASQTEPADPAALARQQSLVAQANALRPEPAVRRRDAGLVGQRPGAPVAPRAFAAPGLVPQSLTPAEDGPLAPSALELAPDRPRGPSIVAPLTPTSPPDAEPSAAERLLTERRPPSDWPPLPPAMPVVAPPPAIVPGSLGLRLSSAVPRAVQERIDEFLRTGRLDPEPFHIEVTDPLPAPPRQPALMRSGLAPMPPLALVPPPAVALRR